jgi:valyl-tRNA synthetase
MDTAQLSAWGVTRRLEDYVDAKHDLIRAARTLRADYGLAPSQKVDYIVRPNTEEDAGQLRADEASIRSLLKAGSIEVDVAFEPPGAMPSGLSQLGVVYMPLTGLVDVDAEMKKLSEQLDRVGEDLTKVTRKLENMDFVSRAPTNVVEFQRARKKELLLKHEKLQQLMETMSEQTG